MRESIDERREIDRMVDDTIRRAEKMNRKLERYIWRKRLIVRIKRFLGFDVSHEVGILKEFR